MHITVKQGIDNCYLAHKYEHPGMIMIDCYENAIHDVKEGKNN